VTKNVVQRLRDEADWLAQDGSPHDLPAICAMSDGADEIERLRLTCDAHCTVINDLQQGSLHKFNEWLMADWTRRYSALNEQTVKAIEERERLRVVFEEACNEVKMCHGKPCFCKYCRPDETESPK
jgi:hypothetical protein